MIAAMNPAGQWRDSRWQLNDSERLVTGSRSVFTNAYYRPVAAVQSSAFVRHVTPTRWDSQDSCGVHLCQSSLGTRSCRLDSLTPAADRAISLLASGNTKLMSCHFSARPQGFCANPLPDNRQLGFSHFSITYCNSACGLVCCLVSNSRLASITSLTVSTVLR